MHKKIVPTFIFILTFTLLPNTVLADAEAQVLEEKIGNTIVRVNYDQDKAGLGQPVPFTFSLLQEDESTEIQYDSLLVNIRPKGVTDHDLLIAEVKKMDSGATSITYDFPKTGEYTFTTRYNLNDTILAEHNFDFAISKEVPADSGFDKPTNGNTGTADNVSKENLLVKYLWIGTLISGLLFGWIAKTLVSKSS